MNNLPLYVTDTHSLIWYLFDSPKLSRAASEAFRKVEEGRARLIIPAIVIAELIYTVESGKVKANIDNLIHRIDESMNFDIASLGINQLRCLRQNTQIPEMHDRLIVCEALLNGAKLITKDKKIKKAGVVEVIW